MSTLKFGKLALRLSVVVLAGMAACKRGPTQVNLEISSIGETMAFDKKEFTVPAGSKVTLTLKNNATSPVMTHNFVLVQKGKVEEVGQAAATIPADKGHMPDNPAILAHTPLSKPGETVSVTFDAPPAGSYEFLCTTPGHYALMRGTFTVQ